MSDEDQRIQALYVEARRIASNAKRQLVAQAATKPHVTQPALPLPNNVNAHMPPVASQPLLVWKITRHAYKTVLANLPALLGRSWAFAALIVFLISSQKGHEIQPAIILLLLALFLLGHASLLTYWVRLQSGLPTGGWPMLHLRCGVRELKVLGASLLGTAASLLIALIAGAIVAGTMKNVVASQHAFYLTFGLTLGLLYGRVSMPWAIAVAQDLPQPMTSALKRGRNRTWKSFVIALMCRSPTAGLFIILLMLMDKTWSNGPFLGYVGVVLIVHLFGVAVAATAFQKINTTT